MDKLSFLAAAADALQPGDKGYIDYKNKPGYNWKTICHSKVLLNGKGRVVAGAGGKFKGRTWGAKWKGLGTKRAYTKRAAVNVPASSTGNKPLNSIPVNQVRNVSGAMSHAQQMASQTSSYNANWVGSKFVSAYNASNDFDTALDQVKADIQNATIMNPAANKNKMLQYLQEIEDAAKTQTVPGQTPAQSASSLQQAAKVMSPPAGNPFSSARKSKALWTSDMQEVDDALRPTCSKVWQQASLSQRRAAFEYSQSYSKFNEPLRGIEYGSAQYVGIGKVDFDDIGTWFKGYPKGYVKGQINDLTALIDSSSFDTDVYLQRGCDFSGLDKFLGISTSMLRSASEQQLKNMLIGTTPVEHAFCSTGAGQGKGFSNKDVQFKIYAPAGTKMMYMEPFASYGSGAKSASWNGKTKQSQFSDQSEVLLQRGTKFKVTNVKRLSNGKLEIEMDVVGLDMQKV